MQKSINGFKIPIFVNFVRSFLTLSWTKQFISVNICSKRWCSFQRQTNCFWVTQVCCVACMKQCQKQVKTCFIRYMKTFPINFSTVWCYHIAITRAYIYIMTSSVHIPLTLLGCCAWHEACHPAATDGAVVLVPSHVVKSLQLIWRLGTCQAPSPQIDTVNPLV